MSPEVVFSGGAWRPHYGCDGVPKDTKLTQVSIHAFKGWFVIKDAPKTGNDGNKDLQ